MLPRNSEVGHNEVSQFLTETETAAQVTSTSNGSWRGDNAVITRRQIYNKLILPLEFEVEWFYYKLCALEALQDAEHRKRREAYLYWLFVPVLIFLALMQFVLLGHFRDEDFELG